MKYAKYLICTKRVNPQLALVSCSSTGILIASRNPSFRGRLLTLPITPMRQATVRSRCECQATLIATVNENRLVIHAFSIDRYGTEESAPAHSIASKRENYFDIAWLCNLCGRNTLRSFDAQGLTWTEARAIPRASSSSLIQADELLP